jgi:plasmid stabilization system protein ParE
LKITYTEEALADIVSALTYLAERSPAAAANLDADIQRCIDRLAAREFDGPISRIRSGTEVGDFGIPHVGSPCIEG